MGWKPKFVVLGTTAYLGSTLSAYFYFRGRNTEESTVSLDDNAALVLNLPVAVNQMAACYDDEIGTDESMMGINIIRWWMLRNIKGNVLELGCGTGRNFKYYSDDCRVVATDLSEAMLDEARKKLNINNGNNNNNNNNNNNSNSRNNNNNNNSINNNNNNNNSSNSNTTTNNNNNNTLTLKDGSTVDHITLVQANAEHTGFVDNAFDTVVDTFGLCSYRDPISVLKEMQRVCAPDGYIVLIEHGRSTFDFLNNLLDDSAPAHAAKWGCFWNRDIDQMVLDSGMKIESTWRWHFGTTYVITARPTKVLKSNKNNRTKIIGY